MFSQILVPLDGSRLAEKALPYAKTLAQTFAAKLLVIRVLPPFITVPDRQLNMDPNFNLLQELEAEARSYLHQIQTQWQTEGVQIQTEYIEGGPVAEMILEQAYDRGVDLIVMSTHGYSGSNLWTYGSVASKVLQQAPCPIFLVRTGNKRDRTEPELMS